MNSRAILGLSLAAISVIAVGASPLADAITGLVKTEIVLDDDEYEKIVFKLASTVPSTPFGGYAVFTSGHTIAVTSHAPFYDSEAQGAPTLPEVISFPGPAALCDGNDSGCGPEWHTHLVHAVDDTANCAFKKVGALTFEEPSEKVKIKAMKIVLKEIEMDDEDYTDAVTGDEMEFEAGNPADSEIVFGGSDTNGKVDGAAFDLNPVFDPPGSLNLVAICIGPPA